MSAYYWIEREDDSWVRVHSSDDGKVSAQAIHGGGIVTARYGRAGVEYVIGGAKGTRERPDLESMTRTELCGIAAYT